MASRGATLGILPSLVVADLTRGSGRLEPGSRGHRHSLRYRRFAQHPDFRLRGGKIRPACRLPRRRRGGAQFRCHPLGLYARDKTATISPALTTERARPLGEPGMHRSTSGNRVNSPKVALLHQSRVPLDHREGGRFAVAPEADVELVVADAEILHGNVSQPGGQPRVDVKLPAARAAGNPRSPASA